MPATAPSTPVPSLRDGFRYAVRMLALLRPHWGRVVKGIGMSTVIGVFGLGIPMLSKLFFDDVYPSRDFDLLHVLVVGMVVATVASSLMGAVRNYYGQVLGARIAAEFTLLFFNRLQHLEVAFFDARRVGEILSRMGDLQRSVGFVTGIFQTVLVNGLYLILVPPILFALNWQLALLALVTTPVTSALSLAAARATRSLAKTSMEKSAEVSAYGMEVLSNIRVIKAVAAEPDTFARMRECVTEAQVAQLRSGAVGVLLGIATAAIRAGGSAIFSWYAWTLILEQRLTLGSFIAFSAYVGYLKAPVGQFTGLFTRLQNAAVSLGRFFEYFDAPVEQEPARAMVPRTVPRQRIRGAIDFDGVTFGYEPERPVLSDLSLSLGPGGVTALVGRSGAGKSSIVKLILRMYTPQRGALLIDGTPMSRIPLADLRQQIAVVWQDNGVLRGTLRDNLVLGAPEACEADVVEAIRLAQLEEFVSTLPDGLETTVAEWGGTLSGGQRQRLAIARALIRRSPILLLDEATSNLDATTEESILRAILPRLRETTVLLVTHRLVSATLADRIFVVEDARLSGGLAHEELLASHAGYQALWSAAIGSDAVAGRLAAPALRRL